MTLLEKAKNAPDRRGRQAMAVTQEHADLVMAWLNGEITLVQFGTALGLKSAAYGAVIFKISILIRNCYAAGLLSIQSTNGTGEKRVKSK